MSCSVNAFMLAAVLVGVGDGKEVGVGELVGVCVLVGVSAGPADGGVAVFIKGLTLVGVAAGRSVGVTPAAARTVSVVTGVGGVCATSVAPIGAQPATMTAANRIKAISLGGLSFLWSAGFSDIITLTYQLNLTQISIRIRLSLTINVDDTSSGPPRAN
jgi:hypothetical protein